MLKTRILTALILLGVLLPALFFMPILPWSLLMFGLIFLALNEWAVLIQLSASAKRVYLLFFTLLMLVISYLIVQYGYSMLITSSVYVFALCGIFWMVMVPLWLWKGWQCNSQYWLQPLGMFLMYSLWLALVVAKWLNPWLLLLLLMIIWISDSSAYFTGKAFGKHKLAPSISPGKTWEGVWGALAANTLFAIFLWQIGIVSDVRLIPLFWMITVVGIYGDLFESFLKRRANLKDSGTLLPGHGGVLDRIDALFPALPIGLFLLFVIEKGHY